MAKEVSVQSGILDLYAPKFGLDELGSPKEKIILKVIVESVGKKRLVLFGSYVIRSRHVQIASKTMVELGPTVDVVSLSRYSEDNFFADVNDGLSRQDMQGNLSLIRRDEGLSLSVDGKRMPAKLDALYTAAARIYGVIHSGQSELRIALGQEVELFDLQRRKLVGIKVRNGRLALLRSFQHRKRI